MYTHTHTHTHTHMYTYILNISEFLFFNDMKETKIFNLSTNN